MPVPPSMHDLNPSNSPSTSTSPSSGTGGLSTQAVMSSTAFQEAQTPSMAVPGPQSTADTGPGHNDNNTLVPTPQALPVHIHLQLNHTKATKSNKQKPNAEPPILSAKKQKIANPMVKPTTPTPSGTPHIYCTSYADHNHRNICMHAPLEESTTWRTRVVARL